MKVHSVTTYSAQGRRPAQEDALLYRQERGIFILADGFGGPTPGAAAAKAACEAVQGFLMREAGDLEATLPFELRPYFSLAGNVLFNSLIHANRKVRRLNEGKGVHERGGASLLAGFLDGDLLALANVGGCEAWLARDGRFKRLVTPRSYASLVDPFADRVDEFNDAPLIAVGMHDTLEPEILEVKLRRGDWLFLQTDGIRPEVREKLLELQKMAQGPSEGAGPGQVAERIHKMGEGLDPSTLEDNGSYLLAIFN